ncbi:hypothetical protein HY251_13350, partial [bacterium]|nr:hypothetical protein [bacterium]
MMKGASVKTDEDFDVLLPKEPVADGGEWTLDPKDAAQVLYTGAEIDAEKSSVKGKLTQVKVEDGAHVGRVEVKGTLTLTRIKVNGQTIDYKDGGALEIVYVVSGSLEPERSPSRTTSIKMLFDGTGSYDTPQGKATLK